MATKQLQAMRLRALRKRSPWPALLGTACGLLLLAGCAGEGIFPATPMPAAPPGPVLAYPSLTAPLMNEEGERAVLTNIEREEVEARLSKLAKDRESGVQRRINQSK